jgi:hypothetical protein
VSSTVADLVADPAHAAGSLEGAAGVGQASGGERLLVRIGLWIEGDRVARARYRATSCASLIAYSEAACRLLESGEAPARVDARALRHRVAGVHPVHRNRADLVAAALRAASTAAACRGAP